MNTFFAIINYESESVRKHREDISKAILSLERKLGIHIDFCDERKNSNCSNSSWNTLYKQFEKAKDYDCVIVFGGDGAQAYIMNMIITNNLHLSFLGISCGTMNIGQFSNSLDFSLNASSYKLIPNKVDAIECRCSNCIVYSFIDAVITTTCVTRIGQMVSQISAKGILNGIRIKDVPRQIGNESTRIIVNQQFSFEPKEKIYTIAAAFTTHGLKAQVLAGGADPIACAKAKWAIINSNFPLTWADASFEDIALRSPISSDIFPLQTSDSAFVAGLFDEAYLICDGNAVTQCNEVTFSYAKEAITVLKLM